MVKIYALLNPINETFFYVGVTCAKLKSRLSGHLTKTTILTYGFVKAKKELTDFIINSGYKPEIVLLAEVPIESSNHCEKFYYKALINNGYDLLQHPNQFIYQKKMQKAKVLENHVDLSLKPKIK